MDKLKADAGPLAEGFDGSAVRPGPNHSTIEIWYDTEDQARAAHKVIRDLIDASGVAAADPAAAARSDFAAYCATRCGLEPAPAGVAPSLPCCPPGEPHDFLCPNGVGIPDGGQR